MFKRILLATAFVGAFTFAGFGTASSANAEVCYGGGFGGGFGPSYSRGFNRGASFYSGSSFYRGNPYRGSSFYRGGGFGYDYGRFPAYSRGGRGVSLRIGF